jgi:HK97 gp10 family phage protein
VTTAQVTVTGGDDIVRKLRSLGVNMDRAQELVLRAGAEVVRTAAADNVRSASSSVASDIKIERIRDEGGGVVVGIAPTRKTWYAVMLERGTRPHTIAMPSGKAMKFVGSSGDAFRRTVHHPGTKAQPFMRPAADENHERIVDAVGDSARTILEISAG